MKNICGFSGSAGFAIGLGAALVAAPAAAKTASVATLVEPGNNCQSVPRMIAKPGVKKGVFAGIATAIGSLLLPKVIEFGVKNVASALEEAAEGAKHAASARRLIYAYQIKPNNLGSNYIIPFNCIRIVHGWKNKKGWALKKFPSLHPEKIHQDDQRASEWLEQKGFHMTPFFYAEIGIRKTIDESALIVTPRLIWNGFDPLGKKNSTRHKTEQAVAATVSLMKPAAKQGGEAVFTTSFSFKLKQNQPYYKALSQAQLKAMSPVLIPLPPIPAQVQALADAAQQSVTDLNTLRREKASFVTAYGLKKHSGKKKLDAKAMTSRSDQMNMWCRGDEPKDAEDLKLCVKYLNAIEHIGDLEEYLQKVTERLDKAAPFVLRADIMRSTEGSKFLKFIAKIFSENSKDIASAIAGQVSPFGQKAKENEKLKASAEQRVAAINAVGTWQELSAAPGTANWKIAAALIKAREACRILRYNGFDTPQCLELPLS